VLKQTVFLEEKTNYFKVKNSQNKQAIFDKSCKQISDWFNLISSEGLVSGQSNYYVAKKDHRQAIFDKEGNQISKWFDRIEPYGLVEGKYNYYVVKRYIDEYVYKEAIFDKFLEYLTGIETDG
jgi:hypothetical protein